MAKEKAPSRIGYAENGTGESTYYERIHREWHRRKHFLGKDTQRMAKEKALTRKSYAENGTLPQHLSSKTLLTPSLFVQKKNVLANFF